MSRALVALALGLALGGPPLKWASSLVKVLLSGTQVSGSLENSNGGPTSEYGNTFDPNG